MGGKLSILLLIDYIVVIITWNTVYKLSIFLFHTDSALLIEITIIRIIG